MNRVEIIKLEPRGRYADGSPIYNFHVPFSSGRVRALDQDFATVEEAASYGKDRVAHYESTHYPGGMGCVLGVVENNGKYRPVINTYYSHS